MVCYSEPEIKYLCWIKRLLFENDINQILIEQLKLYSVMCYFICTDVKGSNWPAANELTHILTYRTPPAPPPIIYIYMYKSKAVSMFYANIDFSPTLRYVLL